MAVPLSEISALLNACPLCHRGKLSVAEKVAVEADPGLFRYTLFCTNTNCTFTDERTWRPPVPGKPGPRG